MAIPEGVESVGRPKTINGIHHLKLPCRNIIASRDFYCNVLAFKRLPQYDHYTADRRLFAVMALHEPTRLIVEFRYAPEQAEAQKGWDPITWGVGTRRDLDDWAAWFDANGVRRSRTLTGLKSWLLGCEDPDGRIVRLYVEDEEHEWTDKPDQDAFWLGEIRAQPAEEDGVDADGK